MDLYQIMCIKKIAEMQNMTLAAGLLNISQPSLSRTLSNVEKELNTTFFDRIGKRLVLNEHGKIFCRYADQILDLADQMKAELNPESVSLPLPLKITMLHSNQLLPDIIRDFTEAHPEIRLNIFRSSGANAPSVDSDFIIHAVNHELTNDNYSYKLMDEECMIGMAASHPLTQFEEIPLEELIKYPFVSMDPENTLGQLLSEYFQTLHIAPRIIMHCDSQLTIASLIAQNIGISLFPTATWNVKPDHIVLKRIKNTRIKRIIYLTQCNGYLSNQSSTFKKFVLSYFQNLSPC